MRRLVPLLALLFVLVGGQRAAAQYYSWGSDPPLKWSAIRTPDVRVIFPDTVSGVAQRTLFYIRTVRPDISYGFTHGPMHIPFVLHPENFQSNGLVMYLPKRVEFLTTPSLHGYSMPWIKQLVAHEYRHAVQYNNLNRGVIRVLSYLFGQQGSTVGLLCMPIWALEGDAVMSETSMSSYGRGLQPSFTIAYRAMGRVGEGRDGRLRRNPDRWFCGSYRDFIPDHYHLGYQICSYAYDRYGENIWNKVGRYGVRNPYVLATTRVGLEKYYDTNVDRLFRETFDDLQRLWDSLPRTGDSAEPLVRMPEGNHTTWQWPLPLGDGEVLALKTDFDRTTRFVRIDPATGAERVICHTGVVSTRPVLRNSRVWWTEYRRSKLFEQRVNSQLCYMDLTEGRPRTVARPRNALYPTAAGEALAWVEYNPDGRYSVVVRDDDGAERRYAVPCGKELHGLAWDDGTGALYVLVTDDSGMWLGRIGEEGLHAVTAGAYITLSNLRAGGGRLYFGSIASGKDEVHCYDLTEEREYRITTSTYGAFDGAPAAGGKELLATTYDRRGYCAARQPIADSALIAVAPARLPVNLVNPVRKRWEVVNLDSVRFTAADSLQQGAAYRTRRYRKGANLLNVHSWMPAAFDPFKAVDEHSVDVNVGLTLLSQNLLSNTEAFASYGWNRNEGSLFKVGVRYFGLGVHLDFDASYGGDQIFYSPLAARDPQSGKVFYQPRPAPEKYYSVGLSASLPLLFQQGYHTRRLTLSTAWNYSNGMVAEVDKIVWHDGAIVNIRDIGFREGLHKIALGASWSDQVRMAHREIAPRWGYTLAATYTFNPADRLFSDLISLYGQVYLPGAARNNSVKLAAAYQTSLGGYRFPSGYAPLSYRSSRLIPRGFTSSNILSDNYFAVSADYQLPVWYPEGGIPSVIYFKRVRLNVGGDFARFRDARIGDTERRLWSVGGDLVIDFNVLRMPASATSTFKFSVYHPSSGGVWTAVSLGLPF